MLPFVPDRCVKRMISLKKLSVGLSCAVSRSVQNYYCSFQNVQDSTSESLYKGASRLQFCTRLACGSLSTKFRLACTVLKTLEIAVRILHLARETAHDRPTNRHCCFCCCCCSSSPWGRIKFKKCFWEQ